MKLRFSKLLRITKWCRASRRHQYSSLCWGGMRSRACYWVSNFSLNILFQNDRLSIPTRSLFESKFLSSSHQKYTPLRVFALRCSRNPSPNTRQHEIRVPPLINDDYGFLRADGSFVICSSHCSGFWRENS